MIDIIVVGLPSKEKMELLIKLNEILPRNDLCIFSSPSASFEKFYCEYDGTDPNWEKKMRKGYSIEDLKVA